MRVLDFRRKVEYRYVQVYKALDNFFTKCSDYTDVYSLSLLKFTLRRRIVIRLAFSLPTFSIYVTGHSLDRPIIIKAIMAVHYEQRP
jgi:hypothetical protein